MTKKCKVISNNPALKTIVVEYEGKNVQFTGESNTKDGCVYVDYKDGKYAIVDEPEQKITNKKIDTEKRTRER